MRFKTFLDPASIYTSEVDILLISWERFNLSKYLSFWFTDGSGYLLYGVNKGKMYTLDKKVEDVRFIKFSNKIPNKKSIYGKSYDKMERLNLNRLSPSDNCKNYLLYGQSDEPSPHIESFVVKDLEKLLEYHNDEILNLGLPGLLNESEVGLVKNWIRMQKINKIIE
jgi:hypothetical protein